MKLNKLQLYNIRNHKKNEFVFTNHNLIVGENAVGKTTIAEAIMYCSFFKSFRTNNIYDLISFGEENAQIVLFFEKDNKENTIKVNFYKNKKKIFLNNIEINNLYNVLNFFNVTLITPDNIDLINSSPLKRRKYIDMFISQLDKEYLKTLVKYKKLNQIKNKTLKDFKFTKKIDKVYLEVLNNEISTLNDNIVSKRKKILNEIEQKINDIISIVTSKKEVVQIKYNIIKENKPKEEIYKEELKNFNILKGAHLDDYDFYLNEKESKLYSSQGQKRLVTISFFIAQNFIIKKMTNETPLIIFDDVYLDLDSKREEKMIEYIKDFNQTIFITTEENNMLKLNSETKIIEIN